MNRYILARKGVKVYMTDVLRADLTSITTQHPQSLYLDGEDAAYMRGKRVLIVDDVVSTGESLLALENLVTEALRATKSAPDREVPESGAFALRGGAA